MRTFIGIDLGSTTTKAVVMDENSAILGRGITNSRSNYDTATRVAKHEALIDTRFTLFRRGLGGIAFGAGQLEQFLSELERAFRLEQYLEQLADLFVGVTQADQRGDAALASLRAGQIG